MRDLYYIHTFLFCVAFFNAFIGFKKRVIIPVETIFFFFVLVISIVEASNEIALSCIYMMRKIVWL